ncbi:polysaccharide deacetylase [Clostridium algoriphilum]|uniref:polysaccharide deacetylase family protein n=1 Tax=Clostridium algoriphilum TaxID=198347 RepID=UPI001CF38689|nr:polysaccharide deacetylase family protein [Clostridium algoriphilum]MCB2293261.1 polysaccharide deacetylase [Clostridium algoriphilum]
MNFRKRNILFVFTTIIICCLFASLSPKVNIKKNTQAFAPLNTSFKDSGDYKVSKYVYLTFDDGPTYVVTDALLDALKKERIKATFFVVGKEIIGREIILKRIYNEGHGIGLHTYSHNFKKIYRSTDEFVNEMKKTSKKIEEITGTTPKIIRFPGGSSKRLNAFTLNDLHKNNFKVYDWNVNLCDGVNPNLSVSQLIKNSKIIKGNENLAIILMHCNSNNKNTVKALPGIIKYYKDLGYEFRAITENTPEYYYKFKTKKTSL